MAMPTPETVGRYQIERLIAHGGMGSLYLARDPVIDRMVAIKFLKEGFDDPAARERFAREARAAGRLHHPNIVTIFDVGEHQDRPFIAMEYVAGETLGQLVGRRAVRRLWEKLEILEELCAGLHYAHTGAIVHRDIKPSNVMRDQTGVVKILDFGIARGAGGGITQAGEIVGTLNYMSPEQLSGEAVDHRTDIYSVGVLAYELVTSQMAFPGTIQTGVLFKILNAAPLPIEALVPGIDPDIQPILDRAIARQPDARYSDLEALRQDLALVRARLFETAGDLEPDAVDAADPNAETRFLSPRLSSGVQPPPSSRAGSGRTPGAPVITARPAGRVADTRRPSADPRGGRRPCCVLALAAAWTLGVFPFVAPVPSDAGAPPPTPSVSTPAAPAPATQAAENPQEQQLNAARATARQQMVAGQNEQALETVIGGLAVDPKDPELNRLVDDIAGTARRVVREARAAAAARGATVKSSAAFRDAQTRERDAESRLRAGDRVPGVRAAWAAATLYNRAPEAGEQRSTAAAPAVPRLAERTNPRPHRPRETRRCRSLLRWNRSATCRGGSTNRQERLRRRRRRRSQRPRSRAIRRQTPARPRSRLCERRFAAIGRPTKASTVRPSVN